MPGFDATIQVDRLGVGVYRAEAVFGHLGQFRADDNGLVTIAIADWGEGLTVIVPLHITDPGDGVAITVTPALSDGEALTIEMSTQGRYTEPGGYTPPE